MIALAAVAILSLCALLPIIGAALADMRRVMTTPGARKVRSDADARMAAMLAELDDMHAYASAIHGRMYADGLLPDRRKVAR